MTPFRKQTRALKAFSDMMQSQGEKLSRKLWPQGKQYCLQPKERHQGLCQFLAKGLLFTPAAVVCRDFPTRCHWPGGSCTIVVIRPSLVLAI